MASVDITRYKAVEKYAGCSSVAVGIFQPTKRASRDLWKIEIFHQEKIHQKRLSFRLLPVCTEMLFQHNTSLATLFRDVFRLTDFSDVMRKSAKVVYYKGYSINGECRPILWSEDHTHLEVEISLIVIFCCTHYINLNCRSFHLKLLTFTISQNFRPLTSETEIFQKALTVNFWKHYFRVYRKQQLKFYKKCNNN